MTRLRVYNKSELKDRRKDLRLRQTNAETILWNELRNNKLGFKFKRQYSISGYVVDFYCPNARLAVELLGEIHNSDAAIKYDMYRKKYLEAFGITFLEFLNCEVEHNIESVLAKIVEAVPLLAKERVG